LELGLLLLLLLLLMLLDLLLLLKLFLLLDRWLLSLVFLMERLLLTHRSPPSRLCHTMSSLPISIGTRLSYCPNGLIRLTSQSRH
jgi:hypothetical protein